ncbi:MAG TPA: hypothetical protein VIO38_16430 [Rariglobus sp.]
MKLPCLPCLLILACTALGPAAFCQETPPSQSFTVQPGSKPWYDRDAWTLAQVPESLKSTDPVPRQNCTSRSLEIAGTPAAITLGVYEKDLTEFTTRNPAAQKTADTFTIINTASVTLRYVVFTLARPPAHIDGSGFNAGMILLKVSGPIAAFATDPFPGQPAARDSGRSRFIPLHSCSSSAA